MKSNYLSADSDLKILYQGVIEETLDYPVNKTVFYYPILSIEKPPSITADKLSVILFSKSYNPFSDRYELSPYGTIYVNTDIGIKNMRAGYRVTESEVEIYLSSSSSSTATPLTPYSTIKVYCYIYYF